MANDAVKSAISSARQRIRDEITRAKENTSAAIERWTKMVDESESNLPRRPSREGLAVVRSGR